MKKTAHPKQNTHCQYCQTPLTRVQISRFQKFCSCRCKNDSQKRIVVVSCANCGKEFSTKPYLKKSLNYCSRECYWDAARKKQERTCIVCGKKFKVKEYLVKQGFGKYCSRECQFAVYKKKRFRIVCKNCGKEFWLAPSVAKKKSFCSKQCKDDHERDYVTRICKNCKKKFLLPRWELEKGKGTFCSRECYYRFNGESSIEALMKRALEETNIDFEREVQIGKYCVDFLISGKKIVIECDGDYWHGRHQDKEKDKRRDEFLKAKGYLIYRFGESEIKTSAKGCVNRILRQHNPTSDRNPS